MQNENAEACALRLLAWMAQDEEMTMRFLTATGADLDTLRTRPGDPDFLASLLDYILTDDRLVIAGAGAIGIAPEVVAQVRQALPGGNLPNWT